MNRSKVVVNWRKFKPSDLTDWEMHGVDSLDYPDFSDAYLAWARVEIYELNDQELDYICDTYPEWINEQAFESLL